MSIKRMSLRFNLDNEVDRSAWEHLKNATDSKKQGSYYCYQSIL